MKRSHIDLAVDEIGRILGNVQAFLKEENKNVQPYQSVKVPDEEVIARYINTPEEVKSKFRMDSPEIWNKYEGKVLNLISRRQKNA